MGVIGFADINPESVMAYDEQRAGEFDRQRQEVERVTQAAAA
jgi:hypothetical protein